MIQKITPFLWFNDNAEEAINFYVSIFKKSKVVSIKRYPEGSTEGPLAGMGGKVLTAVFQLEGQQFMAIDGGPFFKPTGALSLYIECEDQKEVDHYWNALSAGGDPKAQQCGWLQDKFGFSWQVVPTTLPKLLNNQDRAKANRVMQTMLTMKKIDIARLEKAAQEK